MGDAMFDELSFDAFGLPCRDIDGFSLDLVYKGWYSGDSLID